MKLKILISCILFVFFSFSQTFSQEAQAARNKKIVVLGSSVAAGWVTSYQEKYDMQNGYAYRLARHLEPDGWEVANISIPGFDTKSTIERFADDVLPLEPGYVLIGLSMSNEGLETLDPDTVFESYRKGILELIGLCRKNNIEPLVGLCYSNDNYTEEQYSYLKKMNRLINSWDVASVNLLGVLDDGHGHFPAGYTFDPNHPNDRGHEEMFYAFVPDMFDAMNAGKPDLGSLITSAEDTLHFGDMHMLSLGEKTEFNEVTYIPNDVMHSFTLAFQCKVSSKGNIAEIQTPEKINKITINNKGQLEYASPAGKILSEKSMADDKARWVILTHQFLSAETKLYINNDYLGMVNEQLEPVRISIGKHKSQAAYSKLFIFRGALNPEEIGMIIHNKTFHAGIEVASPLFNTDLSKNMELTNLAMSLQHAILDPDNVQNEIDELTFKIIKAELSRSNELKVEHRQAIEIDPSIFDQYSGTYEIEPGDNMLVVKEDDKLFIDDHGRKAEILPEGDDQFFIQYPGDILVIFQRDEAGSIIGLIFSMNGREMPARKLEE